MKVKISNILGSCLGGWYSGMDHLCTSENSFIVKNFDIDKGEVICVSESLQKKSCLVERKFYNKLNISQKLFLEDFFKKNIGKKVDIVRKLEIKINT